MRVGLGYDVHRLTEGRKLILGGVEIPFEKGLLGHSDADCLIHAIMDALLGAAAMGDIGQHFPDTDPRWENADSREMLAVVRDLLDRAGYIIGNIDATIIAQKPKMAPYLPEMKKRIGKTLCIEENRINLKATTEEHLGFTGEGLGISCQAVALLETVDNYIYRDAESGRIGATEGSVPPVGPGCKGCPAANSGK